MPAVLRIQGFKFYFYANDSSEPPHIHVDKGGATAKLWLSPVRWQESHGFRPAQRRTIETIIWQQHAILEERWNEFFGQ